MFYMLLRTSRRGTPRLYSWQNRILIHPPTIMASHDFLDKKTKKHMFFKDILKAYQNYYFNVAVETQNFASLQPDWINY